MSNPRAEHQERGDSLLRSGEWQAAAIEYEAALRERPDTIASLVNLGHGLCHLERWEEAAAAYGRASELDPQVPGVCANLGDALLRLGRFEAALAPYQRAIRETPDAAAPRVNRGHALARLSRWEEAVGAYRGGLALEAGVAAWHANLGDALSRLHRWNEAIHAYRRALAIDASLTEIYERLGAAFAGTRRWEESLPIYRRALRSRPDDEATHLNLGHSLSHLRRWAEAAISYRRATEENPGSASSHVLLGDALGRARCWSEAATAYTTALKMDDALPDVLSKTTEALSNAERWDDAVDLMRRAIERELDAPPTDRDSAEVVRVSEGVTERRVRMPRALSLSRSYWKLGDVLTKARRWDEAADAHRQAEQLIPRWAQSPLPPVDERIEQRITETRRAPPTAPSGGPRAMFLLDADYGELTTVMLFLLGCELSMRSTLLMSDRLFLRNRDVLPGRTRPVTCLDDVLRALDEEKPDVVFLCSAYLLSLHDVLSLEEIERLVRHSTAAGCRVVTTDPFLGLIADLGGSTTVSVDIPPDAPPDLVAEKHRRDAELVRSFAGAHRVVRDLPHLYPSCAPAARSRSVLSFFNDRLSCPDDRSSNARPMPPPASTASRKPRWLFVLASRDYEAQILFRSKERFVEGVVAKLHQTHDAGRHPVLLGPFDLVHEIVARMPPTEGVTLMTFCPFARFLPLLIDAELAFYWNVVSHSMLIRLANRRPCFMFDRGHLVRNVTPLYERAVDWYYQGCEPMFLDPDQPLDADVLATRVQGAADDWDAVASRLAQAPSPDDVLGTLVSHQAADYQAAH